MRQSSLRLFIFGTWLSFWALSTISLMLAPWLRHDHAIGAEDVPAAILLVSGIWIPPLSCLAGFWFTSNERAQSARKRASSDRAWAAILLTCIYLMFVLALVIWPVYAVSYSGDVINLPTGGSFQEQLSSTVHIALAVSPIALGPLNWLTDGDIHPTNPVGEPEKAS